MAVTVRITETYDMKTTKGKMGVVGIHTPTVSLLRKLYPGLLKNHRFVRFVKCDVVGASASALPADPLQVGVTSGKVSPEDMFNPILYTAVTNSSFDTIVARIQGLSSVGNPLASVDGGDAFSGNVDEDNNFKTYYALLSENGKYRKVMPQNGFAIRGLVPLAHTMLSTYGNVTPQGNVTVLADDGETPVTVPDGMEVPATTGDWINSPEHSILFRGKSVKMPRFPIHFAGTSQAVGESITDIPFPNIPTTNVLALILPPAKLQEFWYRMRISWVVRFEHVVSTLEAGNYGAYLDVGGSAFGRNYTVSNSKLDTSTDMVDANDVEITKVMES